MSVSLPSWTVVLNFWTPVASGLNGSTELSRLNAFNAVLNWLRAYPDFVSQYARAREVLHEHWAQEIIEISDTPLIGVKTKTTDDGVETVEGDMIVLDPAVLLAAKGIRLEAAVKRVEVLSGRVEIEV